MTERFPSHLKKSIASGGICFFEISDIGKNDADRIATFDVTRLLFRIRIGEREKNAISCRK